jgi:hypothetical protein
MKQNQRTLDQTVMLIGACLLFLGGLMIGVAGTAKGAPIVGMAHTLGLLEAVFMLAFVALRPYLHFNQLNAWFFVVLTFVSFYCNFAGVCVTVFTGAGADQYLKPWKAYLTNKPTTANFWVWFLLNMSAASVALPVMLLMGWFAKTSQALITWVAVLFAAVMLYFSFS